MPGRAEGGAPVVETCCWLSLLIKLPSEPANDLDRDESVRQATFTPTNSATRSGVLSHNVPAQHLIGNLIDTFAREKSGLHLVGTDFHFPPQDFQLFYR
jgi:hypothetical protein